MFVLLDPWLLSKYLHVLLHPIIKCFSEDSLQVFGEPLLHHCYFVGLLLGPMNYDICLQLEVALSIIGKQKKKKKNGYLNI